MTDILFTGILNHKMRRKMQSNERISLEIVKNEFFYGSVSAQHTPGPLISIAINNVTISH